MNSRVRARDDGTGAWPITLRSGDGRARVRPWWHDSSVAQLTFVDHGIVPSSTALRVWLGELQARGFTTVRTGAVTTDGADMLARQGFETLQRLHLLDLSLVGWRAPDGQRRRMRRLRARERDDAAMVDLAAFGEQWAVDVVGITETCMATPTHRARAAEVSGAHSPVPLAGYAITGRAERTGYLQRLAVHPDCQGRGIGFSLTRDSVLWMQRHHLTRAVVNTHTDNIAALHLYQRLGFRILPNGLTVLQRRLDTI